MRHHGAFMLSWDPGDRCTEYISVLNLLTLLKLSQADMVTMRNRNPKSQVVSSRFSHSVSELFWEKGNPTASMLKFPYSQASWNNRDFVLGMVTKNWRDLRPWIHGRENMIQLAVFFEKGKMIQWPNAVVNGLVGVDSENFWLNVHFQV